MKASSCFFDELLTRVDHTTQPLHSLQLALMLISKQLGLPILPIYLLLAARLPPRILKN